jgi:hypothetical protein
MSVRKPTYKKIALITLAFVSVMLLCPLSACVAPPEQWNRTFNGPNVYQDSANFVQETEDCGYIIAANTGGSFNDEGDAWLIRTDADGNEMWNKTFVGPGQDLASCVQETADGGYIIAGYIAGGTAWLIKTDSDGNEL